MGHYEGQAKVEKQSSIGAALDVLERRITDQSECTGELVGRLSPVLLPEIPQKTGPAEAPDGPPMSDLESQLIRCAKRMDQSVALTRQAIERLTL